MSVRTNNGNHFMSDRTNKRNHSMSDRTNKRNHFMSDQTNKRNHCMDNPLLMVLVAQNSYWFLFIRLIFILLLKDRSTTHDNKTDR